MRSKDALDKIINKSRVHLYKPIQIAEILYHHRMGAKIKLNDIESYRNVSKVWRDEVTKVLVGRASTSSQKFQDNLFDVNAMPPQLLKELGKINGKQSGIVENYIYHKLKERLVMVSDALVYIKASGIKSFELETFLSKFVEEPGLRRSVDKAYEIVVYALFSTLVRALKVEVSLEIKNKDKQMLKDFAVFMKLVLNLSKDKTSISVPAGLFRVGVTNAADRGLDMWANFGPAIQVKHISLSEELAEDVTDNISADKIVLVCLDGEKDLIKKITNQLRIGPKIQGIITLSDLNEWYSLCLSEKYMHSLGRQLLSDLEREFDSEFPSGTEIDSFLKERRYQKNALKGEWTL